MLLHTLSSKLLLAPGCSRSSRKRTAALDEVNTTRFTLAFTHERSTFSVPRMAGSSISVCFIRKFVKLVCIPKIDENEIQCVKHTVATCHRRIVAPFREQVPLHELQALLRPRQCPQGGVGAGRGVAELYEAMVMSSKRVELLVRGIS